MEEEKNKKDLENLEENTQELKTEDSNSSEEVENVEANENVADSQEENEKIEEVTNDSEEQVTEEQVESDKNEVQEEEVKEEVVTTKEEPKVEVKIEPNPELNKRKKGSGLKVLLILLIIVCALVAGGWFYVQQVYGLNLMNSADRALFTNIKMYDEIFFKKQNYSKDNTVKLSFDLNLNSFKGKIGSNPQMGEIVDGIEKLINTTVLNLKTKLRENESEMQLQLKMYDEDVFDFILGANKSNVTFGENVLLEKVYNAKLKTENANKIKDALKTVNESLKNNVELKNAIIDKFSEKDKIELYKFLDVKKQKNMYTVNLRKDVKVAELLDCIKKMYFKVLDDEKLMEKFAKNIESQNNLNMLGNKLGSSKNKKFDRNEVKKTIEKAFEEIKKDKEVAENAEKVLKSIKLETIFEDNMSRTAKFTLDIGTIMNMYGSNLNISCPLTINVSHREEAKIDKKSTINVSSEDELKKELEKVNPEEIQKKLMDKKVFKNPILKGIFDKYKNALSDKIGNR